MRLTLLSITLFVCSCTWQHDGKMVKDVDGNLYLLEASGIRHESYDLKPLSTEDIKQIQNLYHKGGEQ